CYLQEVIMFRSKQIIVVLMALLFMSHAHAHKGGYIGAGYDNRHYPESVFSNVAFNFARSFLHLVALFGWRLPCLTAHRHDF
ncbi:hypothetical protein, partial [Thiolapillus sp.]|uniref:hypothetical protein n=1 Tax=Thiolapillus sp. TaxID=2017437 RepID=UPI003AF774D2